MRILVFFGSMLRVILSRGHWRPMAQKAMRVSDWTRGTNGFGWLQEEPMQLACLYIDKRASVVAEALGGDRLRHLLVRLEVKEFKTQWS